MAELGPLPRMCLARHLVAETRRKEESLSAPGRHSSGMGWLPISLKSRSLKWLDFNLTGAEMTNVMHFVGRWVEAMGYPFSRKKITDFKGLLRKAKRTDA